MVVDHPFVVLALALSAQWLAGYLGDLLRRKVRPVARDERTDLDIVLTASLTLLALLIGFSFSMAVSRYDQRKTVEAAETNAISTEFRRADLLPEPGKAQVQDLLRRYLDERVGSYRAADVGTHPVGGPSRDLQSELWSAAATGGTQRPTPVAALAVSGMTDVFNSGNSARAAWLNRIPATAWALLAATAILVNLLLGYRERRTEPVVLLALPVVISIALFLIADIDSPHGGLIRVVPANLETLAQVMLAR